MIVDKTLLEEYPYDGYFYRKELLDSPNLEDRKEVEKVLWSGKCDIQENSRAYVSGFSTSTFAIFFSIDKVTPIPIKRGDSFKGSIYGLEVNGEVTGVFPSQIGGCLAYVKEFGS